MRGFCTLIYLIKIGTIIVEYFREAGKHYEYSAFD